LADTVTALPISFPLRLKNPGHGFTVDQDQKALNI
jgi:hypothetical protein